MSSCKRLGAAIRAFASLAFAALVVAACGSLPQPFSHHGKVTNPLLAPGERAGINVVTVAGTRHGKKLSEKVAAAFRAEEFAATVRSGPSPGYTLVGRASTAPAENAQTLRIRILWRLLNPKGRPGGLHHQEVTAAASQWAKGSDVLLDHLAADAVASLAPLLSDPRAEPAARHQVIAIYDIEGAPGDGRIALRRALAFELRKRGFRVGETKIRGQRPVVVLGAVQLSPVRAGKQRVAITWTVLAPGGQELGSLKQANDVAAGSLDTNWGISAIYAARAAAPGIAQVIARTAARSPR